MSEAMPWAPPEGWWTMIRRWAARRACPARRRASRKLPIEAAWPMQTVPTLGRMYCMVSWIAMPAVTTPPGELMYMKMSFFGFSHLEEQQLGGDQRGHMVLDLAGDEDDPLAQQARKMSKLRSPRFDCSMTMGTRPPKMSWWFMAGGESCLVWGAAYIGAKRQRFKPQRGRRQCRFTMGRPDW